MAHIIKNKRVTHSTWHDELHILLRSPHFSLASFTISRQRVLHLHLLFFHSILSGTSSVQWGAEVTPNMQLTSVLQKHWGPFAPTKNDNATSFPKISYSFLKTATIMRKNFIILLHQPKMIKQPAFQKFHALFSEDGNHHEKEQDYLYLRL